MKKLIFFVFLMMATIMTSTAMARSPKAEPTELFGMVTYFGNAPFEYLGIKTDDGKVYRVEIRKNCTVDGEDGKKRIATESDIAKLQGWKIKFFGKIDNNDKFSENIFVVEEFYVQK